MSNSQDKKNIFVNVLLSDILSKEEITSLRQYPQFQSDDSSDLEKIDSFEKNDLVLKFISTAINKLLSIQETTLAKCLRWSKTQIQMNLDYKPDALAYKNLELLKQNKPNMKVKLGWMEEYSQLNKQQDIYNITKVARSPPGSKINQQSKTTKAKSLFTNTKEGGSPKKEMTNVFTSSSSNIIKRNNINTINEELLNFESTEFNIFKLEDKIGAENILPTVSSYVFASLGLFSLINYTKFENFVYKIAKGYIRSNPYHTDLHAADMVQTSLLFVLYGELKKVLGLSTIDITSLFLSGIIHDYKHPGLTNNYLILTKNEIAIRYNDQSVLENYHVAESFKLINSSKDYDIFELLSADDFKLMRKRVIECVLATDMTLHNKEYHFLKMRIPTFNISKGENVDKIFENVDNVTKYNIQQEFLNVLIHAADVSNPTKPLEIYKIWAKKVVDEFFLQGDKERSQGMKISFLCDRNTVSFPQSQLGFIEGIVLPLYNVIVEYFPNIGYSVSNINGNIEYFKKLKEEEEKNKK